MLKFMEWTTKKQHVEIYEMGQSEYQQKTTKAKLDYLKRII